MTLHPLFMTLAHEAACAPFVVAGPVVEAVRARLAERAMRIEAETRHVG